MSRTLFTGGRVFTADVSSPFAEAIVVDGETVAYVGDEKGAREAAGDSPEIVDLGGGLVLPG